MSRRDESAPSTWRPDSLLGRLSASDRAGLLRIGTSVDLAPAQPIIRAGETGGEVFVILTGYVKITVDTEEGETALLAIRTPGDIIGELSALDERPRSATATACSAVRVRVLTRPTFVAYLRGSPTAAIEVGRMQGERLRWANDRRVELSTLGPPARVRRILLELARVYGGRPGVRTDVPLTQPEIASMAGVSLRSVEKEVQRLQEDRVICCRYGRIEVLDWGGLAAT
ncbi:Crp/Fnr family transcriptional regulator [Pseudonocardia acaciae]|uniref:Crp/Fnr family transcriptional regulator n=1 Tax=Pseudonocardia acaciae TaxID=551276 RepID=UPI00055DFFA6|nr:Crp/Fnr family transcriptional regulator [Pseudonocardia acaciae]